VDGSGRYTVALSPGRYAAEVDRDVSGTGEVRLQLKEAVPLAVEVAAAPIPLDLDLAVRYRVDGTVALDGQPRSPVVSFRGPDARTANATDGAFTAYLAAGSYTATANVTEGLDTYLVLHAFDVASPTSVALALVKATNVTGSVRDAGNPIGDIPVTFTAQGGGSVTATSDASGQYHVFLLGGAYAVTVDHPGTAQAGAGVRYVRYTFSGSLSVTQNATFAVFPVDLSQALDNTTVAGNVRHRGAPASAQIAFVVKGANGMNGTAASGPDGAYTVAIQPGSYDVYAFAALERGAF
ncbi:MAG: carboxypeptidase-like regulatory domain-containing protein, partial [Candidatus Thermoplasmatota archaeon]